MFFTFDRLITPALGKFLYYGFVYSKCCCWYIGCGFQQYILRRVNLCPRHIVFAYFCELILVVFFNT